MNLRMTGLLSRYVFKAVAAALFMAVFKVSALVLGPVSAIFGLVSTSSDFELHSDDLELTSSSLNFVTRSDMRLTVLSCKTGMLTLLAGIFVSLSTRKSFSFPSTVHHFIASLSP